MVFLYKNAKFVLSLLQDTNTCFTYSCDTKKNVKLSNDIWFAVISFKFNRISYDILPKIRKITLLIKWIQFMKLTFNGIGRLKTIKIIWM